MLEPALLSRLLSISALNQLVSSRIYALVLPQNERRAAVRYQVQGAPLEQHLRGPGGFTMTPVQIDSYVPLSTVDALFVCRQMADAIKGDGLGDSASGLWGWIGTAGGSSPESIEVSQVELLSDGDALYESDAILRVRVRQLYRMHWRAVN
jgi:hypothetical protein